MQEAVAKMVKELLKIAFKDQILHVNKSSFLKSKYKICEFSLCDTGSRSLKLHNHDKKGKGTSYTAYNLENINIFRNINIISK